MTTVNAIFNNEKANQNGQLFMAFGFLLFTILALGIDSVVFLENYFDGRTLTNFLAISYFALFFYFADLHLRKLMFAMVFLSYIGELIFCTLLEMYQYRTDVIPLYVPFGHAIVYASGYVFAHTRWAIRNEKILRKFFVIAFTVLFLSVGFFLNDWFSLIFGVFFFLLLKRKKWQNLYYFIALCVIYIELLGTYFQCWTWVPKTFNTIPTANPPMGAVFFYAGGDVLLAKIVEFWERNKVKPIPS
ncbi:hypothetical protein J2X31_000728 [Flavobacterium arsenatis]|uniref:Uncharacterized protein n=1 Tax=Flavobacterium arsenatis TaxID=1484332 RepID=A0ABU1TL86_9FLAO|nr:hypothetical protein [Flavobacterium arsenatis]MDR6966730.1 hypothetical protein [Flavobacterium arsenatis]